jgi:hypothetical protein
VVAAKGLPVLYLTIRLGLGLVFGRENQGFFFIPIGV